MFQLFHVKWLKRLWVQVPAAHHCITDLLFWSCIAATAGLYEVRTKCGVHVLGRGRTRGRCRWRTGPCLASIVVTMSGHWHQHQPQHQHQHQHFVSASRSSGFRTSHSPLDHHQHQGMEAMGSLFFFSARKLYQKKKNKDDMHPPLRTVPRVPAYRALARLCIWVPIQES